jgi:hypothetical protein
MNHPLSSDYLFPQMISKCSTPLMQAAAPGHPGLMKHMLAALSELANLHYEHSIKQMV